MTEFWYLLWIVVGLPASAFFSGIETGLISLNRIRLRHEVEHKNRRAAILSSFVENSERLLGTTLVGNNLVNTLVAVCISALTARWFGEHYWTGFIATFVSSLALVVLGEIVPKTLFRKYSYRLCMSLADLLNAVAWVLAPFVGLFRLLMRLILRFSGGADQQRPFFVTREELKHLAKEGEDGGALSADERQMIHGVFDFPYKTIQEVMLPMGRILTLTPQTPVVQALDISRQSGYARMPVREGDKIIGVLNVYELLFAGEELIGKSVADVMQPPQFLLATDRINRVLPILRSNRNPISVVVTPANRHIGIVTIEDIVEEIVGDVEG